MKLKLFYTINLDMKTWNWGAIVGWILSAYLDYWEWHIISWIYLSGKSYSNETDKNKHEHELKWQLFIQK